MRNLKVLGLGLIAVFVVSAMGAPAALADEFTAESYPATLTGKRDPAGFSDLMVTTAGNISCTDPSYSAKIFAATTFFEVSPNYSSGLCSAFGLPATIDVNGCSYRFSVGGGTSTLGGVDLICPVGKEITVTQQPTHRCIIHMPSQFAGGFAEYANIGAGSTREITVKIHLIGLDYSHTKGSGLAACASGSGFSGTFTAEAVITGETSGGSHQGVFMS